MIRLEFTEEEVSQMPFATQEAIWRMHREQSAKPSAPIHSDFNPVASEWGEDEDDRAFTDSENGLGGVTVPAPQWA